MGEHLINAHSIISRKQLKLVIINIYGQICKLKSHSRFIMSNTMTVEIQYFNDCPNSSKMIGRVKEAMKEFNGKIHYLETLVEDKLSAEKVKFRGSPTLLINGEDFENLSEPISPNLSCRFYHNGLPTIEEIKNIIQNKLQEDQT